MEIGWPRMHKLSVRSRISLLCPVWQMSASACAGRCVGSLYSRVSPFVFVKSWLLIRRDKKRAHIWHESCLVVNDQQFFGGHHVVISCCISSFFT
jgi:hypothetical protein